jgi:hypothetical protein
VNLFATNVKAMSRRKQCVILPIVCHSDTKIFTVNGHSLNPTASDHSDSVFVPLNTLVTRSQRQEIQVFLSFLFGVKARVA